MEVEIIAGAYDCFVRGYSFDLISEDQQILPKFHEKSHTGCVKALSCGGRYLASGSTDETIKLYDLHNHTEVGTLVQHTGTVTDLVFFGSSHLLSASDDQTICIWDCIRDWECLHVLKGHRGRINSVSIHPSGKLALSVANDKTLRMWNLLTGRISYVSNLKQVAELVVWSLVGDQYVLAYEKTLSVCDVQSGSTTQDIVIGKHINTVKYIRDKVLAVGSELPVIQLINLATGKCLHKLEGHTSRIKALALAPGNSFLFSASSDGTIRVWKLTDNLSECSCVCHVDTKCRLTCMTLTSTAINTDAVGDSSPKGKSLRSEKGKFSRKRKHEKSTDNDGPTKDKKKSKH